MALTKKKKVGNAHGKKRGPKKAPQGKMTTADSPQRHSAHSLARSRAGMQKLKLTLAVVPGGAYKYGEICMALRVLLQLIDESFTSSIKTLKWDMTAVR